jgi:hypothetical protein
VLSGQNGVLINGLASVERRLATDRRQEMIMWGGVIGCIVTLTLSLLMAPLTAEAQQGFPDSGFSQTLAHYTALANAGTYQEGSFITYWVQRLTPVWGTLPERQQQFYLTIFRHYDGVLRCRSTRECSQKEMNDIFRWSLDPSQEAHVFETNIRQLQEHLARQKESILRQAR